MPTIMSHSYSLGNMAKELERQIEELKRYIQSEEEFIEIYVGLNFAEMTDKALRTREKLVLELKDREEKLKKVNKSLKEIQEQRAKQTRIGLYVRGQFDWYKDQLEDIAHEIKAKAIYDANEPSFRIESDTLWIELRKDAERGILYQPDDLNIVLIDRRLNSDIQKSIFTRHDPKIVTRFDSPTFSQVLLSSLLKTPIEYSPHSIYTFD